MAGIGRWWSEHGLIVWLFAQFAFDVVVVALVRTMTKILRIHQEQMRVLARVLNVPLPKTRGYI